jgi:hypothetical protein
MSRTIPKLILACMLLLGTVFLPGSSQATTCCSNCQTTLDTCEANCHGSSTCNAGCVSRFNTCSRGCGRGGCGV